MNTRKLAERIFYLGFLPLSFILTLGTIAWAIAGKL
jgi:hypothetical protein